MTDTQHDIRTRLWDSDFNLLWDSKTSDQTLEQAMGIEHVNITVDQDGHRWSGRVAS